MLRDSLDDRAVWGRIVTCTCVGKSFCCSLGTITTLLTSYDTLSCSIISDLGDPWTIAHQATLSMGLSQQEYGSELPLPPPENLPIPGIKPVSLVSPKLAGGFFTIESPACMLSHFSCVWFFATLWTGACQAPLSMGFFRRKNRSGLLCPPPGDLPNPGIKLMSPGKPLIGYTLIQTTTIKQKQKHTGMLIPWWST